jgi:hypothetical protein
MKTEKTNMDYLYEFIKDNDEAKEFWEAVSGEIEDRDEEIIDLKDARNVLKEKNASLNSQLTELLGEPVPDLQTLDFGFGEIKFIYPDNLKLQSIMDELKNNPEKLLQFE